MDHFTIIHEDDKGNETTKYLTRDNDVGNRRESGRAAVMK